MSRKRERVESADSAYSSPQKDHILEVSPTKGSPVSEDRIQLRDNLYGIINVHKLCQQVLKTDEMTRLKNLKQLGLAEYVYPTAIATRYNHSLGVMHLAKVTAENLSKKLELQGENCISRKDILCLELAGLLHDIGHGPYSHLFEEYVNRTCPDAHFRHEEMSLRLIDRIFVQENIKQHSELYNITAQDIRFIKELVYGPLEGCTEYSGRDSRHPFLYRIINNKLNGIDVDKIDYLMRDSLSLGLEMQKEVFIEGIIQNMEVVNIDGKMDIAYCDKTFQDLELLVVKRGDMHKEVYKHPDVKMFDEMTIDLFTKADPYLEYFTSDNQMVMLSQATSDCYTFLQISEEDIKQRVKLSRHPGMSEAKEILDRMQRNDCYHIVCSMDIPPGEDLGDLTKQLETYNRREHLSDRYLSVMRTNITSGIENQEADNIYLVDKCRNIHQTRLNTLSICNKKLVFFTKLSAGDQSSDPSQFLEHVVKFLKSLKLDDTTIVAGSSIWK